MGKLIIWLLFIIPLNINAQSTNNKNYIDSLGYKQGEWIEYEGRPRVIATGLASNPLLNIHERLYYYDYDSIYIVKLQGNYINSLRDGKWLLFSSYGNLLYSFTYTDGIINGPYKLYEVNGEIRSSGIIHSGSSKSEREIYSEGVIVKVVLEDTRNIIRRFIK